MPYTNRESEYINYFDYTKGANINNELKFITIFNNKNSINNELMDETTPEDLYMNRNDYNFENANNLIISQNINILHNMRKQNSKKVNNPLLNIKETSTNLIYSPKRGLGRLYSQEKFSNRNINLEQMNLLSENRIINKNNSSKDIKVIQGFTYNKKHNIYKTRNCEDKTKNKNATIENIPHDINKLIINSGFKRDYMHDGNNNFNNIKSNVCNLLTKREENDYFDELNYDIKPDVYPEIKINLKNSKIKNKKNRNKSAIIKNNNNYNLNNNTYRRIMHHQKNNCNYIYTKYINNSMDENLMNSKNTIDNSMNNDINRLNKSNIISNQNLSLSNDSISKNDLISSRQFNFRNIEKSLSIKGLYYIFVLEEKVKDIADSLISEKIESIQHNCFELINYNYNYNLNNYIQNFTDDIMDMKDMITFNKYNIFAIMILYELTFNERIFINVKILIKEMLKLIYANIILIINHSKDLINNIERNNSIVNHIINNLQNKYSLNKELYMDDSEYLLIDENSNDFCHEKINYNINFIIRNIHTIINNMRSTKNYNLFLNIFKKLVDTSIEEINYFFKNKILKINKINSPFLSSELLKNNSQNNIEKISVPYISKPSNKMYSLVISLDDNLIHFQEGSIKNNKGLAKLRPGLSEFFDAVKPYYEIIVFSCGNKKYSDLILNSVDNKNIYIDYRLYRDHCIIIKNDYVKDITRIGRSINKIIIVDNIPQNYRLNKDNGIYIKSFYGNNPNDKVLFYLSNILVKIAKDGGDVRDGIKKYWNEIIIKISSNIFINYY